MNNNIDINSDEFQVEIEKTWKFIDKVNNQFGLTQNPDEEINEGVAMGLARNRLIYGKRYCPCFIVQGETKQERKEADNRICPCKPALETEIPDNGVCHCGIFCTPEYAKEKEIQKSAQEEAHTHSRGLSQEEAVLLLKKEQLDGDEIEALLEAREIGMLEFSLIDVREPMEFKMGNIKGTNELLPTTKFYEWLPKLLKRKDENIILYCHTGSRSYQVQQILRREGMSVGNFTYGIISYMGEVVKG
jgi:ferredoxin-thioredoxin reductase catalytic subunit/rhodanese-related sulfurtransferase